MTVPDDFLTTDFEKRYQEFLASNETLCTVRAPRRSGKTEWLLTTAFFDDTALLLATSDREAHRLKNTAQDMFQHNLLNDIQVFPQFNKFSSAPLLVGRTRPRVVLIDEPESMTDWVERLFHLRNLYTLPAAYPTKIFALGTPR